MDAQVVDKCTIFLALVGSRAYGIHDKNSDYDKKGVLIPPSKYLFGTEIFEQFCDYPGEDKVIFDFKKVVNLIADNNPNMLDLLFSPEKCILTLKRPWEIIIENRDLFLSKRCRHTYSGYAFAQLRKLDDHRRFLLNPPKVKPERKDYGLPDVSIFPTAQLKAVAYAAVREFIVEEDKGNFINELDDAYSTYVMPIFDKFIKPEFRTLALDNLQVGIKAQAHTLRSLGASYIKDEYLEAATKELKFYSAYTEWQQYQFWLKNRNKARAELERKFTYDTKHAAHMVRLIRMCKEILETGKVNVDRTNIDAEELKAIRYNGIWSYQELVDYARKMDDIAEQLYRSSTLPELPDTYKIKDLYTSICEEHIRSTADKT